MSKRARGRAGGASSKAIFLSYGSTHYFEASLLRFAILTRIDGATVFLDRHAPQTTMDIVSKLRREIERCRVLVVLVSPDAARAAIQGMELCFAIALEKPMFILVQGADPSPSSSMPMLAGQDSRPADQWTEMLEALAAELNNDNP